MAEITWDDFQRVELRVGTILSVDDFPAAKKPSYRFTVDFGPCGIKKSSAQVTALYSKEELVGRQVIAVLNFPKKQIANFLSEVLITGFADAEGAIVLAQPERKVPNGTRLV